MTGKVTLRQLREQMDEALRILRGFAPPLNSPYRADWNIAMVVLENISVALYVRSVDPDADETLTAAGRQGLTEDLPPRTAGA